MIFESNAGLKTNMATFNLHYRFICNLLVSVNKTCRIFVEYSYKIVCVISTAFGSNFRMTAGDSR